MRVAIVGSRGLHIADLSIYLPTNTTQIVSGGAKGIDTCAKEYALSTGIDYVEFLPDYRRYGKGSPLKRNEQMIACADLVIAFWDAYPEAQNILLPYVNRRMYRLRFTCWLLHLFHQHKQRFTLRPLPPASNPHTAHTPAWGADSNTCGCL